jgi:hypothetical protein
VRALALSISLVLAAACAGTGEAPEPDDAPARVPKHETYLRHPTKITGDEVHVILPRAYEDEVEVEGLSYGWREKGGKRTWEGTGRCRLSVLSLRVEATSLTVTLVPEREEPEVMIQASGDASYRQEVRDKVNANSGLAILQITNDRLLER